MAAAEENAAVGEQRSRLAAALGRVRRGVRDLPPQGVRAGRQRVRHLRNHAIIPVQAGLAAALAWLLADDVLRNPDPVFAPAVAVGTIVSALGQRLRRAIETVVGVAVGIAAGDLLVVLLGTGPWQTGLIVALAVVVAILLRGGSTLLVQTGGTAVLVATLTPANPDIELPRFVNAVVGGLVGLAVVRTAGSDLLRATGIGRRDANRTVRRAAGRSRPPSPPPAPPRP